jgi:hypothetical protein
MAKFFNQSWLMEGDGDQTRELSHLRSNIKIITERNTGDLWANVAIGNPTIRECKMTNVSGTAGNQANGSGPDAQTMRPLGSSTLTNQDNLGSVFYDTSGTRSLEMDYVIEWYDDDPVTYHIVRTGKATISMPMLADGTNAYGHGLILDQWNEMDIKHVDGVVSLAATADFDFGVIVAKHVTLYGDPVIEDEITALSSADFQARYGTTGVVLNTDYFLVDNDLTSPSYGKYFGFITYSNTRPVSAHIRFINKRF